MRKQPTKPILGMIAASLITLSCDAQFIYTGVDIDINNVRARINNECSHFWDPQNNSSGIYEIPKGSGKMTIYAGSIWMGGYDNSNQLHIAAQTYNQLGATSFWPGPMDISNGTSADPNVWNQIWKVNKTVVQNHIANWNTPGYVVPPEIVNWPGNAPAGNNFMSIMAPFFDTNNNQLYEPALGEYPAIYGDQAVYFICNDNYATTSLSPNMKVEIHGMAWAFTDTTSPSINNTVFMRYQIFNRSGLDYHDVAYGLWADADIGDASDDKMGTDVGRSMQYFYNGDGFDGSSAGYGAHPPAQGIKLLNETMTASVCYTNINGSPSGNPALADDYYQFMNGLWLDSSSISPSHFMFSGTTDTSITQNWTMASSGILPTDMRGVLSSGGHTLPANGIITIDAAYITALIDSGGPDSSITLLQTYADDILLRYANGSVTTISENLHETLGVISIFPNPMNESAKISFSNVKDEKGVLTLTSLDGKQVLEKNISNLSSVILHKSTLPAGLYIITARFKNQTLYNKLVID